MGSIGANNNITGRVITVDYSKATGEYIAQSLYSVYRDFDRSKSIVSDVNFDITSGKRKNALAKVNRTIELTQKNIDNNRGDAADLERQLKLWNKVKSKLGG